MSNISKDIPTISASANDFENLIHFVYKHEEILKEFGGIKIQPDVEFEQSFKKRRTNFPLCSNVQEVKQISKDELIYSINPVSSKSELSFDKSESINENEFWESLSYSNDKISCRSNVSVYRNKSFYSTRPQRNSFDLHRLPKLSLLKIGGNQIIRNCVPSLIRSHGSGAIYTLSSFDHRLFSIDYHHQGGIRHWYIIPNKERIKIQLLIKDFNSSMCLNHQNIIINPSVFEKYNIRYHRLIQHPNEFVVLSAGAFSQGFSENSSWNETIGFALPSWIHDGHANDQLSPCNCHLDHHYSSNPIDINPFRHELVQKWIENNLTLSNHQKTILYQDLEDQNNRKVTMPINTIDHQIDLYDVLDDLSMDTSSIEAFLQNNSSSTFSSESLMTLSNQFLPDLLISSITDYSSNDQTLEKQSQIDQNLEINFQLNNINQKNIDEQFSSVDQMDYLQNTSISNQTNKKQQSNYSSTKNIQNNNKIKNQEKNIRNTLYVSGLTNNVSKKDLHRHFIGSNKITIKQHQMPPYLKYAFVVHRTHLQCQKNRRRPINFRLFGSECRVEYFQRDFNNHYLEQPFTIVVNHIPEYVTERQLHQLFIDCQSFKYYPGRTIHSKETKLTKMQKKKILSGYAFIQYYNAQQANNVLQNSDRYRINGEPLNISFYNNNKSQHQTKK